MFYLSFISYNLESYAEISKTDVSPFIIFNINVGGPKKVIDHRFRTRDGLARSSHGVQAGVPQRWVISPLLF